MTSDDETAKRREIERYETAKRYEIEQLVVLSWENEAEVDRVASRRMFVEGYYDWCKGLLSGHFQSTETPSFNPDTGMMEWSPPGTGVASWAHPVIPVAIKGGRVGRRSGLDLSPWDRFTDALRSGRKQEVARLASEWKKFRPPQYVIDVMFEFFEGKIKGPPNRPSGPVAPTPPSAALKALEYAERLRVALRDMCPTQKASEVRRRAKKIAAARYNVTLADVNRLTSLPKSRRR